MMIKKIKKLLYLLQLEEYQTTRYFDWLKKNKIERLEERKGKLKITPRIILTFFFSFFLISFGGLPKGVGLANNLLSFIFGILGKLVIFLAKIKLKFPRHLIKIVITGSYGKTTFKERLAFVLENKYLVFKTPGNINTALGVAIEILKNLKSSHQVLIIEAGAYKKGEIKEICQLVKPDYGVITIIGWMHLERFKMIENIRLAKFEIKGFIKNKKQLFYPPKDHQFIDFGKTIKTIAGDLGISTKVFNERTKKFTPPLHRLTVKRINQNLIILDDTYNSNPLGFEKAIEKLKSYKNYQKVVVTPGMVELGVKQVDLNEKTAFEAAKVVDIFMIVSETNKNALENGAKKANRKNLKIIFINKDESFEEKLNPYLKPPTAILLENDLPDHYF